MSQIRIRQIANLIKKKKIVIDVGSDHAKLSKILINEKRAEKVINLEKNNLPLKNSICATKNYFSKIENIKSDGLNAINSSLLIDTCVIAGLGGKTIFEILSKAQKKNIFEYIIQANNNEEKIRVWAKKFDWKIKDEFLIEENKIIYEIIILSKEEGYIPETKKDFFFGKINLYKKDYLFQKKWKNFLKLNFKEDILKFNFNKKKDFIMVKDILNDENNKY